MPEHFRIIKRTFSNTGRVVHEGGSALLRDPQIAIYAYLGVIFIWVTSPFVTNFVVNTWRRVEQPAIQLGQVNKAPHVLLAHLGLVTFSVFYTVFVTAYFTCAISVSTWRKLDGQSTSFLYGLRQVARHFFRVTWFALMAVFFFPLTLWILRKQLLHHPIKVAGRAFSLSMTQLAPAIMTQNESVFDTVTHSLEKLGEAWHESLLIRIGTIISFVFIGLASLLPAFIQQHAANSKASHLAIWLIGSLLSIGIFVLTKVMSTVLTTTLFYKVTHKQI